MLGPAGHGRLAVRASGFGVLQLESLGLLLGDALFSSSGWAPVVELRCLTWPKVTLAHHLALK